MRTRLIRSLCAVWLLWPCVGHAAATTYYVSPTGTAHGAGSLQSPWDLRTALAGAGGAIRPDDTVYLLDGRYPGHFATAVAGTNGHPITFRAAPDAHPVIDGNFTATSSKPISAGARGSSVTVAPSSMLDIHVGDFVRVGDESFQVQTVSGSSFTGRRGRGGYHCAADMCGAHPSGESVFALMPILLVKSAYVIVQDLEVTDSGTDARGPVSLSEINFANPRRQDGVSVRGAGAKIIDCVIHDTAQGLAGWADAPDSEYSGNIIFNNGFMANDRGHGHGIYTQNETGSKLFYGDISFNNYGFAWQQYGSSAAHLDNFTWDHVVAFNTRGSTSTPPYNIGVLWGGGSPMHSLVIDHSSFYRAMPSIGYSAPGNTDITVRNSRFRDRLTINFSKNVTVAGNLFAAPPAKDQALVSMQMTGTDAMPSDFAFSNNVYHHANTNYPYSDFYIVPAPTGTPGCPTYWFNSMSTGYGYCGNQSWQEAGFDVTGSTFSASQPTGLSIDVFASPYNPRRITIVVFNWDHQDSVSVDLSNLVPQAGAYTLRNVADYFGDVRTGQYDGSGTLTLPMTGHTVAKPYGSDTALGDDTFPEFGCFVLELTAGS